MNKFSIIGIMPETDNEKPVLYKVYFSDKYYLHKGKLLAESITRFLDDIFRGTRGKSCPECYSEVVKHCLKYPSMYKVSVELVMNDEPGKVLKKEIALYTSMKKDDYSLNRLDIEPYKPEWMVKQSLQQRCVKCVTSGFINVDLASNNPCFAKKQKFQFCPNCGRLNK